MILRKTKKVNRQQVTLRGRIFALISAVVPKGAEFDVTVSPRPELGHYATNVAFRLAKETGKPPMELAAALAKKLKEKSPRGFFADITVAPPGFVNFTLTPGALHREFARIAAAGEAYGATNIGKGKTAIVEYASLNIAKPFHVGYLRNIAIGDALARLHAALGYAVIRWNYLGDWGTQFGKLIAAYRLWGKKEDIEREPIRAMLDLYVRFHDEVKYRPELEALGREEFRKLEAGDAENRALWTWFKDESLKEFARTLAALGVEFDLNIGESFFEGKLKPIVERLLAEKLAVRSEGAVIVPLEAFGLPPAMAEKSDGGSLYLTRDLANLAYRVAEYQPAKILYVVGNEQALHFEQVFHVAKLLGLGEGVETTHVKFGLVFAERGQKFSTREGNVILLEEVIAKAEGLARSVVEEKNKELSPAEREAVARAVAIGALKYANLRENRSSDVIFDWDTMLSFSGDSGPYLQYTHARLRSIIRKAQIPSTKSQAPNPKHQAPNFKSRDEGAKIEAKHLVDEHELAVIRKLAEFPEAVRMAGETHAPNALTLYLYELANTVNRFYENVPIASDEYVARRAARLALVGTAAGVLERGLGLLGIEAPERM